jgi:hypothetical protein
MLRQQGCDLTTIEIGLRGAKREVAARSGEAERTRLLRHLVQVQRSNTGGAGCCGNKDAASTLIQNWAEARGEGE